MEYSIFSLTALIIAAAYFIAGVFDAVCGGGGLVTMPMLMAIGLPIHNVAPTNQCTMCLGSVVSFGRYVKNGRIYWPAALIASPFSIVGAFFGARLNQVMSEDILKLIMLVLVPVIGAIVIFRKDVGSANAPETLPKPKLVLWSLLIGLVIGGYQGFYGAGSGTFFLLAFAILIRLDLVTASGCTKLVLMCAVLTASVTYAASGLVYWQMVATGVAFSILGNYIGAGLALKNGARVIRPMFLIVLLGLICKLVSDLFF